ncbi:hypothetical protein BDN70DRAFT_921960 [Pholiota conissans]|uniref:F-box domain-containing protein n=1 Tax=Pholiota conissans TaxID=109636 RepID=A0A9P5Z1E7_9AGAR|nr:hypothetical protein BDN70DRAFT_921960 [Pholiota conissans]
MGAQGKDTEHRLKISLTLPVPHLLNSNYAPTEKETQIIQETITLAQQEDHRLKKLSDKIPRFTSRAHDATYRECQKLRKDVQNFILKHQRLVSDSSFPFRCLPTELLVLIFLFRVWDARYNWSNTEQVDRASKKSAQPWTASYRLAHVCQRWRAIVFDTPQLWACLDITLPTSSYAINSNRRNPASSHFLEEEMAKYFERLQEMLHRSKNEELWLSLRAFDYPQNGYKKLCDKTRDLLAGQSHRLAFLTFQTRDHTVKAFCDAAYASDALCSRSTQRNPTAFPRLKRLILDTYGNPSVVTDGFVHAPALQEVTIRGAHPHIIALPLSQLRIYNEDVLAWTYNLPKFLETLLSSSTGNLERLHLTRLRYRLEPLPLSSSESPSPLTTPPTGSKLAHIHLDFSHRDYYDVQSIGNLLTYFHYPAIQTLRLNSPLDLLGTMINIANDRYPQLPTPFVKLTKLYYRSTMRDANTSSLVSFLRLSPNLEELDIELPSENDLQTLSIVLARLHLKSPQLIPFKQYQTLAPKLRKVYIHTNFWKQSDAQVERMLASLKRLTKALADGQVLDREGHPLLHIELIFEDGDLYRRSKIESFLNNRVPFAVGFYRSTFFSQRRDEILVQVPAANIYSTSTRYPTTRIRSSVMYLSGILDTIDKHRLSYSQMKDLYVSGLHLCLNRLSRLPVGSLPPGYSKHHFRGQAKAILDRWEPLHRKDLCSPETLTLWAKKGHRKLVFVPLNDPRRTGPDAMKLIYGMDDYAVEGIGMS